MRAGCAAWLISLKSHFQGLPGLPQTLLSVFNQDLSPDSHSVTYAPSDETYGLVNNGGANEILWKAPSGAIFREGYRPVVNLLREMGGGYSAKSSEQVSEWNTSTGATINSANNTFSLTATSNSRLEIADYNPPETAKGKTIGLLVQLSSPTPQELSIGVKLLGSPYHQTTRVVTVTATPTWFWVTQTSQEINPRRAILVNTGPTGAVTDVQYHAAMITEGDTPPEYVPVGLGGVDPTSGIDGMEWKATENGNTFDVNGVVDESVPGTPIPESQLRGVKMEGAGGNIYATRANHSDLTLAAWNVRGTAVASLTTERTSRYIGLPVSKVTGLGTPQNDVYSVEAGLSYTKALASFDLSVPVGATGSLEVRSYNGASSGLLVIDLTLVSSTEMERITPTHSAVTSYTPFVSTDGSGGIHILRASGASLLTVYINAIQQENSDVATTFTDLSSRAATSPSTVVESVISPDEGAMQVTLNMKVDRVDFTPATSLLFIHKGTGARLLYFNPTEGDGTFLSYNGTTVTSASLDFNKGDQVIYELHYSKSANDFYIKADNVTQGTSIESTHQPFSGFVFSGDLTVGDYGTVFPTLANVENLMFIDQPGGDFFF